jgi:hypothetical protein
MLAELITLPTMHLECTLHDLARLLTVINPNYLEEISLNVTWSNFIMWPQIMCQCLYGRMCVYVCVYIWYALGTLCCWHVLPALNTFCMPKLLSLIWVYSNEFCMILAFVNIPVQTVIVLPTCIIAHGDVLHSKWQWHFSSASVSTDSTTKFHQTMKEFYQLYIFIHICKNWLAKPVEKQVKCMTSWKVAEHFNFGMWFVAEDLTFLWHNVYY